MHVGRCTLSYEVFKGEILLVENSIFSCAGQFCDFVIICRHACLVEVFKNVKNTFRRLS